jgi:hypothetical protein
MPHMLQVERSSLISRVYFATDICNNKALDFMSLKNRRKTYPLRNEGFFHKTPTSGKKIGGGVEVSIVLSTVGQF